MIPEELKKLIDANDWKKAIAYIDSLSTPCDEEILVELAWCCSRAEEYNRAIGIYNQLIEKNPEFAKWYYARGYQYYMMSDWQKAIDDFSEALRINPDYFKVKYRIAYALLKIAGDYQQWTKDAFWKAIMHLEECHKIYESYNEQRRKEYKATYADICFLHGKTIMPSDKYIKKSISLLEKANSYKNDNDYKYELAKAYYCDNQLEKALDTLPNIKRPYYIVELRAQVLTSLKRFDDSNTVLFNLINYRKKDYLYRRVSENYLYLNDLNNAENNAIKALSLGKGNYKNYLNYGLILKQKKQYLQAIKNFEKARQIKQKKFNYDCVEAIEQIEEIQSITNNNPYDEPMEDNKLGGLGVVEKYNSNRGFGFIKDSNSLDSLFFHVSDFTGNTIRQGDAVKYSIETGPKGKKAVNIILV